MGKGHGERLSAIDALFLRMETQTEHLHTAGLFVFDPPRAGEFDFARFVALIRSRLHLVPRFRQKLTFAPLNLANPVWIDDEQFDLSYHVRHAALPSPGRTDQLMDYVGRIISRPLDRSRPLWELYVIEGLEEGRVAYLGKTHHALVDGISGIDIATLLLEADAKGDADIPDPRPWHPSAPPSQRELTWSAAQRLVTSPRSLFDQAQRLVEAPRGALSRAGRVGRGMLSMVASTASPGPSSPINNVIGAYRRFAIQRLPLDDVKQVKNAFGTTVNDVVLTLVGDAVGRFLRDRGEDTDGLELKVMVPVSVRTEDERHLFGNRITSVFIRLPISEMDPVQRLRAAHEAMKDTKEKEHAVSAEFLLGLSTYAPPTLHAMAARLAARTRVYNIVVTNVPGPQVPLYSLGMRLLGAFPAIPLTQNHSLAVGVTSIDGWLNFGFTADWDAVPDLDSLPGALVEASRDLVKHAEAVGTRAELARKPVTPESSGS